MTPGGGLGEALRNLQRYVDRETFHGLLVPLRKRRLGTTTKAGMVAMGEALKQRVEAGNRPV